MVHVRPFPQTHCKENLEIVGLNHCTDLRKLLYAKKFRHGTLKQWKKIIWNDESRFPLFSSHGCIGVRREADEAICVYCLLWQSMGAVLWSGVTSVGQVKKKNKKDQLVIWIYWRTRFYHQKIIFFPDESGISQDDTTRVHQAQTLIPLKPFWGVSGKRLPPPWSQGIVEQLRQLWLVINSQSDCFLFSSFLWARKHCIFFIYFFFLNL